MSEKSTDLSRRDKLFLLAILLIVMFGAHACLTNCREEADEFDRFLEGIDVSNDPG